MSHSTGGAHPGGDLPGQKTGLGWRRDGIAQDSLRSDDTLLPDNFEDLLSR